MKKLFLFILIGFTNLIVAQSEFLNQSNTISGSKISLPPSKASAPKSFAPSVFTPNSTVKSSSTIPQKSSLQFTNTNKFANPGDVYESQMNKKMANEENSTPKSKYYGGFKTKSDHITIWYRDFGEVDGDEIRVWVNDMIIANSVILSGEFKGFELGLTMGSNKIYFEALNEGINTPNTGEFETFDDKNIIITSNRWDLVTGSQGYIIIVRE